MKGIGWALMVGGIAIALCSLGMTTTAPVDVPSTSLYGLPTRSNVFNLGLLQNQLMVFIAGCAIAVAGAAVAAVGHGLDHLTGKDVEPTAPGASPSVPPPPPRELVREPTPEERAREDRVLYSIVGGFFVLLLVVVAMAIAFGGPAGNSSTANMTELNDEDQATNLTAEADSMLNALAEPPKPTPTKRHDALPPEDVMTDEDANFSGE